MSSTAEFRKAFVARLKQACDESKSVPQPGLGRQQFIATKLGVAPEAVSKWFNGVAMPKSEKMEVLAEVLEVDQAWLHYGITPAVDRAERKRHAKEVSGAAHVVFGLIQMAGGYCGEPPPNDPRSAFVDFYATIRGRVYPIHVALAREIEEGVYEVNLPKEYAEVRVIGVIPQGGGRLHFLEMPAEMVERHKQRKAGVFAVRLERAGNRGVENARFVSGEEPWPRIRTFEELS